MAVGRLPAELIITPRATWLARQARPTAPNHSCPACTLSAPPEHQRHAAHTTPPLTDRSPATVC